MKSITIFISAAILSLACGKTVRAQPPVEGLSGYIEESRQLFGVPGLAVGILKDGKVVMNQGFGVRHSGTDQPVDSLTIFGIASCSKAFTAACFAMLNADSLISWNDRVVDLYPDFRLSDSCITADLRIQDLLSHRSGLQTFDGDLLWYGTNYSRGEVVRRIRFRDMSYGIRSRFGYQNVMYIAAGELLEEAAGISWDEFMEARIFKPLQMSSSSTSNSHFHDGMNLAYPHLDGDPMDFIGYDNCGPAASVNSCSADLLHWVELWLGKGSRNGSTLFPEDQYYKMTAPLTPMNAGPGEEVGGTHFQAYGLGWFLFDYKGRKVIQHGGGLPGFHSKVVLVPEENLGFVILANQLSGLVEAVYRKILDHYIGDPEADWARSYFENQQRSETRAREKEEARAAARTEGTAPSFPWQEYRGIYEDRMYGTARVEAEKGMLHLILEPTRELFSGSMEHWEHDTFRIVFHDPFLPPGYVTFHSGTDREGVTGFTIDLENPDFHFYKLDFEKID